MLSRGSILLFLVVGCGTCARDDEAAIVSESKVEPAPRIEEAQGIDDDAPSEGPLDSVDGIWAALRIGAHTFALVDHTDAEASVPQAADSVGQVVVEGRPQPMRFFALELPGAPSPATLTVVAPGAPPCIASVQRRVHLIGACPDWAEAWTALEVDCEPPAHQVLALAGAHPDAALADGGLDALGVTLADVAVPDDMPDLGVFRDGRRIARLAGPAYPEDAQLLTVDAVHYPVVMGGFEGYFRHVVSLEDGTSRQVAYPATTCGAF